MNIVAAIAHQLRQTRIIEFAFLHGSFTESRPFNDVDIAAYFNNSLLADEIETICLDLSTELAAELGLEVDLHSLNTAPLGFCYYATQGKIIFSRDREQAYQYREKTWLEYMDYEYLLRQTLKDLLRVD